MRDMVLAAAAVTMATGAVAQTGAPASAPMQPGGWVASGWQAGQAAATSVPAAVTPAAAAPAYGMADPGYAPPPSRPYKPVVVGGKVPRGYADPIYAVQDWRDYGLAQPYAGTRWVRYFDDAILVDARGRAIFVQRVAWDAPRYRRPARTTPGWTPPVASTRTERHGDTIVTTQVIPPPRGVYGNGYGPDYGWGPGVTVTPSIVTTTTTTVTEPAPRATRRYRARRR